MCENVILSDLELDPVSLLIDDSIIYVWQFENAPEILKDEFNDDGDEDWICLVHPSFVKDYIGKYSLPYWVETMSSCHDPKKWLLKNGWMVVLGTH